MSALSLGAVVRRAFGPLEGPVASAYRRAFFDVAPFAADVARRVRPARVLEVGCGEGAVLSALVPLLPESIFKGIDITPRVGRLFAGDARRVTFQCTTAHEEAGRSPGAYDLVLMCDVLHHVPVQDRGDLLDTVRRLMAPGALFVFKDWEPSTTLMHAANIFSDRVLTGDSGTVYLSPAEARRLLDAGIGRTDAEVRRWAPRHNNFSLYARAALAPGGDPPRPAVSR